MISMKAFQNTYPCSSKPCKGGDIDIDANVPVDYEK
jgi:hypothetical protein